MGNINKFFKTDTLFPFLLIVLFCIPTFIKIITPGYFPMHDDFHVMRTFEMNKCFSDWQFPCRWVPDMGFGYGYPEFNFYAPAPYYIMEVFHLLGSSYLDSSKIFIILVTLGSAWGMYLFSHYLWKNKLGGFLSSFLYTYLPYRAVDIYVRGALPELAAMAIIPFVFLFAIQIVDKVPRARIYFALSLALLFLTHTISIVIVTPFLLCWILFLLVKNKKDTNLKTWIDILVGFAGGLGLSAFFVIPAWIEKSSVHIDTLTSGYFNYLAHFVSLKQLLFSYHWGYGVSELGVKDDISLSVGIPHWVAATLILALLLILKKKKALPTTLFFFCMAFLSLFFVHERSTFIWKSIPTLAFIQFPWRILIIPGFFFSAIVGSIGLVSNKSLRLAVFGIVSISTFFLYQSFFQPKEIIQITDVQKLSGSSWTRQISASIYDYLPISAAKAPDFEAPDTPKFVYGEGNTLSGSKKSNSQIWNIEVLSDMATIELPVYYFPNWVVMVNQKDTSIDYANEHGLMRIELSKGIHDVSLKLEDTLVRTIANIISSVSFVSVFLFVFL